MNIALDTFSCIFSFSFFVFFFFTPAGSIPLELGQLFSLEMLLLNDNKLIGGCFRFVCLLLLLLLSVVVVRLLT